MQPVVTVGLDGSPERLAAARWAAEEAGRRKLTLRLLHAWPMLAPEPARLPAEVDQNYWAKRLVDTAQAELRARHPGLATDKSLVADERPVVLVRAEPRHERGPATVASPVVVALKLRGSPDGLLDFAFHTAAARDAHEQVSQALQPWREKYPGVDVAGSIRLESPAKAVVRAAEGASQLVVGRRRHRTGLAPHLGPVAQATVHHGRCPVAVVPHD
ncbi:universal stress protein [Streptomyces sp. NPDC001135]